ncbi:hypothetical protein SDC9_108859 [bioreactor metagenome]|uniref:PglD N-terminal domain-containing protein n=1 Tax=bioreactor metagenome TaxID=1076179 RepID=A0A645BJQ5_9ZZZZ|nr:hypothetical protein [Candidatus Pelethousia sp.]
MNETGRSILLLGGAGHCKSVLCALLAMGKNTRIGIVAPEGTGEILGMPVIGRDEDLPALRREFEAAFVVVGSLGDTRLRRYL